MQKAFNITEDPNKCKTEEEIEKWLDEVTFNVYKRSTFVDLTDKK